MSNNAWGQHPRQPYVAQFAQGPQSGGQPGLGPSGQPGVSGGSTQRKRGVNPEALQKVFPVGMLTVFLLTIASGFLRYHTLTGSLLGDEFFAVRNLYGYEKYFDSDGLTETGFDFKMTMQGETFNHWTAIPLAAAGVLGLDLTAVTLTRSARSWWATPVFGLVASLTQFFWVMHLANFKVKWIFDDADVERKFDLFGETEFTIGLGVWCWMALGLIGAAISVFELIRMQHNGQAQALFGPVAPASKHWIMMAAAAVATLLFALLAEDAARATASRWNPTWFYGFAYWAFIVSIGVAVLVGLLKRWTLAWVITAIVSWWLFAWFFISDIQTENALWQNNPGGVAVWIICALIGIIASARGLRLATRSPQPPAQPKKPAQQQPQPWGSPQPQQPWGSPQPQQTWGSPQQRPSQGPFSR